MKKFLKELRGPGQKITMKWNAKIDSSFQLPSRVFQTASLRQHSTENYFRSELSLQVFGRVSFALSTYAFTSGSLRTKQFVQRNCMIIIWLLPESMIISSQSNCKWEFFFVHYFVHS